MPWVLKVLKECDLKLRQGIAHLKLFSSHLKSTAVRECAVYSRVSPMCGSSASVC